MHMAAQFSTHNEIVTRGAGSARALAARQAFDVSVAILEVRHVPSRRGLGAAITANDAPQPLVSVRCAKQEQRWLAPWRGADAVFDRAARHTFAGAHDSDALVISIADQVKAGTNNHHAKATLPLAALDLTHPVYMWLPADVEQSKRRRGPQRALNKISDGAAAFRVAVGGAATAHTDVDFDPLRKQPQQVRSRMTIDSVVASVIAVFLFFRSDC